MSDEIIISDRRYISSKRASEISGYSQDYIGQLARSAQIVAQRIGGLWYVSMDSLEEYKKKSEAYKPQPPNRQDSPDAESFISFDGKEYVSAARASQTTGYHQDYVGQLARSGKILSKQVGNRWYVERHGIAQHKKEKDALLAAVQIESVGLQRKNSSNASGHLERYASPGPLLTYTTEEKDLIPNLAPIRKEEAARIEQTSRPEPLPQAEPQPVPSMVQQTRPHIARVVPQPIRRKERTKRRSTAAVYGKMAAAALTIVIVLSFGFASLKSNATYTLIPEGKLSTASAAAAIEKIGQTLENWVSRELVYKRSP